MKIIDAVVAAVVLCLASCTTSTEPETPAADSLNLSYDSLGFFPYSQTLMTAGYGDKVFVYGAYGKLSVYNAAGKTLTTVSTMSDTITWRWDGAFVTVDTMMYILAIPTDKPAYYKVLTLNPRTNAVQATSAAFIFRTSAYPAAAVYGKKIVILYPNQDSLYVFDTGTLTGQFVSQNKLKNDFSEKIYTSALSGNNFYVFNNKLQKMYQIDMQTFAWTEIVIPDSVKSAIAPNALGGMIENKFCLLNPPGGSGTAVAYNMETRKWLLGTKNTKMRFSEPSFASSNTSLYGADVFTTSLWRVSLVH